MAILTCERDVQAGMTDRAGRASVVLASRPPAPDARGYCGGIGAPSCSRMPGEPGVMVSDAS
jgi:hypothetical protein